MKVDLSNFIPHLAFIVPLGIAVGFLYLWLELQRRNNKRPPFTKNFLRSPGETLDKDLRDYQLDGMIYMMMGPLISLLFFSAYSWNRRQNTYIDEIIILGCGVLGAGYFLYKFIKQIIKINRLRLGLEGERAIGEELNQCQSVNVTSVVTIPGWFIDRTAQSKNVFVLAGGEIIKSFKTLPGAALGSQDVDRISHQLESTMSHRRSMDAR